MKVLKELIFTIINISGTIAGFILKSIFNGGKPGASLSMDRECCPRCKMFIGKYDMMLAPDGVDDNKWCISCINKYNNSR